MFYKGDRVFHTCTQEMATVLQDEGRTGNVCIEFEREVHGSHDIPGLCYNGRGWVASPENLILWPECDGPLLPSDQSLGVLL